MILKDGDFVTWSFEGDEDNIYPLKDYFYIHDAGDSMLLFFESNDKSFKLMSDDKLYKANAFKSLRYLNPTEIILFMENATEFVRKLVHSKADSIT